MMMQVYYKMLPSKEGWRLALWFSVVINVNLALFTLFPVPVLDGGHILLALIEAGAAGRSACVSWKSRKEHAWR